MSALTPKADICSALTHVRFVPIADIEPFHSSNLSARSTRPAEGALARVDQKSAFAGFRNFSDTVNGWKNIPKSSHAVRNRLTFKRFRPFLHIYSKRQSGGTTEIVPK